MNFYVSQLLALTAVVAVLVSLRLMGPLAMAVGVTILFDLAVLQRFRPEMRFQKLASNFAKKDNAYYEQLESPWPGTPRLVAASLVVYLLIMGLGWTVGPSNLRLVARIVLLVLGMTLWIKARKQARSVIQVVITWLPFWLWVSYGLQLIFETSGPPISR